jgi:hypothetical protein
MSGEACGVVLLAGGSSHWIDCLVSRYRIMLLLLEEQFDFEQRLSLLFSPLRMTPAEGLTGGALCPAP